MSIAEHRIKLRNPKTMFAVVRAASSAADEKKRLTNFSLSSSWFEREREHEHEHEHDYD